MHLVELGQVGIEHDLVAADQIDPAFDYLDWNRELMMNQAASWPTSLLATRVSAQSVKQRMNATSYTFGPSIAAYAPA